LQEPLLDLNGQDYLYSTETPDIRQTVTSQTGFFEPDPTAFQSAAVPGVQLVQTEGVPIAPASTQSGPPSNIISNPQFQLVAPAEKNLPIPSPVTLSYTPSLPSGAMHPIHASHAISTHNDVRYSRNQLDLLKKLSDSGTDGVVISAVVKNILSRGSGLVDGVGLGADDTDLLQKLSDLGTDGSVIKGIAESAFQRGGSSADKLGLDASGSGEPPGPLPTGNDAPPVYDFIGT